MQVTTVTTSPLTTLSKPLFVHELKSKSVEAFDLLYETYAPALFGFIRKNIPDEVASEQILGNTFKCIWSEIESYSIINGRLLSWMLSICLRESIQHRKATSIALEVSL